MNNITMTSVLVSNMRHTFKNYRSAIYGQFTSHGLDKNMTCTETPRTSEIYR